MINVMKGLIAIKILSDFFKMTLIFMFVFTNTANAAGNNSLSILRDAEIEQIIRDMTEPLFIAAELDKDAVKTYLLNDNSLNAFVMGGQNIFIHSGLLLKADTANQVIGVLAHETGHITGGHLSRFQEGMSKMATYSLLGVLLGIAALAAGSGDAGLALMMGGQHIGYRSFLRFSRTQESSADQAALSLLEKTEQSGRGLIEFFEILGDQELVPEKYQDPYARTHPMNSIRIERVRDRVQESPFVDNLDNYGLEDKFQRLKAKLYGYLKPYHATMVKYPIEDKSINARYARTFAYQNKNKFNEAIDEINGLIEIDPNNPFFHETKGQILYENGNVVQSLAPYRKAVSILPQSDLLRMSLAQSLISTDDDQYLDEALKNLTSSLKNNPQNSFGWKQASIAYHRLDDKAMTHYSTAQYFLLSGNIRGAMINAKQAVDLLPKKSSLWIKAQDIMIITQSNLSDKAKKSQQKEQDEENDKKREDRKIPERGDFH